MRPVGLLPQILLILFSAPSLVHAFQQGDSDLYVSQFQDLIANSYAAVDDPALAPVGLLFSCQDTGYQNSTGTILVTEPTPTVVSAAEVQQRCGETTDCVIGGNVTLNMDGALKVRSLVVRDGGTVEWSDLTQTASDAWLCAGYVVVEAGGTWEMNLQDAFKRAWIYIMNNGATHHGLRTRAFGSFVEHGHRTGHGTHPYLRVVGRELDRTWSLLAEPLQPNSSSIRLIHDPIAMGWQVGDRIAVAPTESGMDDNAQAFFIAGMQPDGTVTLDRPSNGTSTHRAERSWPAGTEASLRAAEVINLSRNVIVTGDDFEEIACDSTLEESWPGFGTSTEGCMCTSDRSSCTMGLHAASAHAGFSEVANARIEKCGQRGVEGKYCLHFHHMSDCSNGAPGTESRCIYRNNAMEFSQQRGLILHSTHHAQIEANVFYDVRGANLYIEDGNEMLNTVAYNVGICPRGDNGCTLPGTSNGQADTSLNQTGLYMESPNNLLVGNRMVNFFNGMFNNAGNGRAAVAGQVCGGNVPIGFWEGNTFHSNGRFGTYLLNGNFPLRDTGQSVANNGTTNGDDDCAAYDAFGEDAGLPSVITNHFDYGNAFVGQYAAGDIQYRNHVTIDNLNSIYWKETKTFQDGCSAHISDSHYEGGSADLPDAMGAFIIEDTTFENYGLRANHHCDVGVTGYLCMPQYVLHDVTWSNGRSTWVDFDINNGETNNGGIFTLSPENIEAKANGAVFDIFPPEFNAVVGGNFNYLLDLPEENCAASGAIGLGGRYDNGILCAAPLTALKVFTRNHAGGDLVMTVFDRQTGNQLAQQTVPHLAITDRKQGYSVPVISGDRYRYVLTLASGQDFAPDWVIDFGDLTVSNRWGIERLHLDVQGRSCSGTIYSNHDRRFYTSGDFSDAMWGGGACTGQPAMPASDCSVRPDLTVNQNPAYAPWHDRLDAACATVDCGDNGACSARYLGASLPVLPTYQCVCREGWYGETCSTQDPGGPGNPGPIEIDGRILRVDNEPYEIRGVAWNPVPRGGVHPSDLDFSGFADIDIPLMEELGINTVRTYEPIVDTVVLDKLHAAGIKVINSAYNWGGAPVSSVDSVVNAVGGHPAILMWSVGNEWNYNGLYIGLDLAASAARVNEVAQRIKSLDPNTPVATIYGELPSSGMVEQLNHIDVWGVNVYRGISFGDLFDQWHGISGRPMFIGEYGADAYNANLDGSGSAIGYDPESQSDAVVALTREIFDNIVFEDAMGNQRGVLGGLFFEWADEWWKAGNPDQHDVGGVAPGGGPYPDGTFNEEYWGITDIDRNRRCGFYTLQALYASIINGTPFAPLDCGQVGALAIFNDGFE
ncbi:hypothetical protein HFP89_03260 [Wenzhouxiangella sp. XN79A]|uniref:glycoside hydrolase family 2 TIM barrel-domain containing protein n=1 Tax=Wenzhouxiangella sp. XN79A TaxID=2724193 RepID=UPI00144A5788|nr:glycoside hydrolase family 2 TIM barrel-domain containing protein [Wenzhouxiangella sp. XN79A]NKI34183.1 hypothetical protein [Wenzhouxiangella sp. XN79A]